MSSPYRAVLGPAFEELHPRLRAYFDGVPSGSTGRGGGVFDRVGTPRRWLWPLLLPLGAAGVAFPAWQRDVPFEVENVAVVLHDGSPAVRAVRRFRLHGGVKTMRDEIGVEDGALVDRLGDPVLVEARFRTRVRGGALLLTSTRVVVRFLGLRLPLPSAVAPVVALTERYDEDAGRQTVSVVVRLPLVGRIYQYAGSFRYKIEPEE